MSSQLYKTGIGLDNYGQKCVEVVDSGVRYDFTYVRDISHDPCCIIHELCVNNTNECLTWREMKFPAKSSNSCFFAIKSVRHNEST